MKIIKEIVDQSPDGVSCTVVTKEVLTDDAGVKHFRTINRIIFHNIGIATDIFDKAQRRQRFEKAIALSGKTLAEYSDDLDERIKTARNKLNN